MKLRCKTCRIRKVKCDGARPACARCASTGRTCDGFGIWDSGIPNAPGPSLQALHRLPFSSAKERDAFDWYLSWTTLKLPGIFRSSFWSTLVLQACHTEPSVLSAALALGLAHRTCPTVSASAERNYHFVTRSIQGDRTFLEHYIKALGCLRDRRLTKKTKASLHVSLITCVLFACLELMLGHYRTGERLLQHGVQLLRERNDQLRHGHQDGGSYDDWIREALERLCVPAIQLGGPSIWNDDASSLEQSTKSFFMPTRIEALHDATYGLAPGPPPIFESTLQAREMLDRLLHASLDLAKRGQPSQSSTKELELHAEQSGLQLKLRNWKMAFTASRVHLAASEGTVGIVAYQMLDRYYNMTYIMLETCIQPGDQMAFDKYADEFKAILKASVTLYDHILVSNVLKDTVHSPKKEMARFVADRGWIMPLYYTATKCRVRAIRVHAVDLLEKSYARESVWDSHLAAAVAREIMEIEESDFYQVWEVDHSFTLNSIPGGQKETEAPVLPERRRVLESRIELPQDPWDRTMIHARRRLSNGTDEILTREYNPAFRKQME